MKDARIWHKNKHRNNGSGTSKTETQKNALYHNYHSFIGMP